MVFYVYEARCNCGCNGNFFSFTTEVLSKKLARHNSRFCKEDLKLYQHMKVVGLQQFSIHLIQIEKRLHKAKLKVKELIKLYLPLYNNRNIDGRVYKLICSCGCNRIYVGSTTKSLNERLLKHFKFMYEGQALLYNHMKEVGKDKFTIELLENVELIEQLKMVETEYYDILQPQLNSIRPFTTYEERLFLDSVRGKIYRDENKEKEKIRCKKYYEANKEVVNKKKVIKNRERNERKKLLLVKS
jgi:hypothetical protein